MELPAKHLEALVCPVCRQGLRLDGNTVACTGCGRRYPVEDGLPVLISARATPA
ncbi:Trm112 family protein [Granulicella sp. WH15]|nr:Trm112 family protein [Granulicella sp. WH15]